MAKKTKNCVICGSEFETVYPNQKYCSAKCADVGYRRIIKKFAEKKKAISKAKRDRIKNVCLWCHGKLNGKGVQNRQKYCSIECGNKYRHMLKAIFKKHPFEDTLELRLELEKQGRNFKLR